MPPSFTDLIQAGLSQPDPNSSQLTCPHSQLHTTVDLTGAGPANARRNVALISINCVQCGAAVLLENNGQTSSVLAIPFKLP
jgi:hypothetical protein